MSSTLKYKDFAGPVQFSAEDEVFHGKLIGIDDLVTFEGESVTQLKESFEEAVDDYLELCESVGKSPFNSYKGSFNVRISPALHKQLAHKSLEMGVSLKQLVEQAINEKLEGTTRQ